MFKPKKDKTEKENLKNESENIERADALKGIGDTDDDNTAAGQTGNIPDNEISSLKELEKQVLEFKDQLLRKAAEFENYKRRTEAEFANVYKYANEGMIVELLTVLDDFERVLNTWNDKHDADTLKKGIELVNQKFRDTLKKQGIKEMESVGKPFDVNLHDAIMQKENNELEPNTITDEVEKGYFLKDKVIRHAKVVVSKKPE